MKTTGLIVLNCIRSIKNLLKIDLSYSEIQKQIKKRTISEKKMNFADSKFSKNEEYRFPYTQENAIRIIDCCQHFTNVYELLLNTYLPGDLNLHSSKESLQNEVKEPILEWLFDEIDEENFKDSKFANSNLDQKSYFKTLKIADWSYEDFIVSTIFFYLENLYSIGTTSFKSYEFQDRLYFYKKIEKHCSGNLNFFHILFYLKTFDFIPKLVLTEIFKYSY